MEENKKEWFNQSVEEIKEAPKAKETQATENENA